MQCSFAYDYHEIHVARTYLLRYIFFCYKQPDMSVYILCHICFSISFDWMLINK